MATRRWNLGWTLMALATLLVLGSAESAEAGSVMNLQFTAHRLEGETKIGKARRDHMSVMERDVERTLGRIKRHPQAAEARALLQPTSAV